MEFTLKQQADTAVHTPASVVTVFTKLLRYAAEEKRLIEMRGVYLGGGMKSYGGVYYDQCADELTDHVLTIKVPEALRVQMEASRVYTLTGMLERSIKKDGSIQLLFAVQSCGEKQEHVVPKEAEEQLTIMNRKVAQGFEDIPRLVKAAIVAQQPLRVAFIFGESAIVDEDVFRAMQDAVAHYEVVEFRTNLSRVDEILSTLEEVEEGDYGMVCLVRGGGTGLEVFDELSLVGYAAQMNTPLAVALGHAQDVPFLERVADKVFPTPTALGVFFREMVEQTTEEQAASRAHLLKTLQQEYEQRMVEERKLQTEQRQLLEKQLEGAEKEMKILQEQVNGAMGKKDLYLWIGIATLAALVVGLLLGMFLS